MKSPITGKEMVLRKEPRTMTFRKEEFTITYHYFLCEDSGEQFTTAELDEIDINQLYNQYREKYNIPFPDEIKAIRDKYGLSAAKMAEALGFGANVYRNYENGEVPNESNGKLIRLAQTSNNFCTLVRDSKTLDPRAKENILEKINDLMREEQRNSYVVDLHEYFLGSLVPDEFTGYRKPHLDRLIEMIVFFTEQLEPYKTKLNKLLFYSDFVSFRKTCYSLSGTRYAAIDLGPVPNNFESIFDFAHKNGHITIEHKEFDNGGWGAIFHPVAGRTFNKGLFSTEELETLTFVADTFRTISAKEIKDLTHREKAWKENFEKGKQLIGYKYGFELETI